jgi:hypothetical protein
MLLKETQNTEAGRPAPKLQQALPSSTVQWLALQYALAASTRMRVVGNLIVLGFVVVVVVVGEYTKRENVALSPLRRQTLVCSRAHHSLCMDSHSTSDPKRPA